MAIDSTFYDTVPGVGVNETQWAVSSVSRGTDYGVVGVEDFSISAHPTTPYAVVLSSGKMWGHGVFDVSTADAIVQCDPVLGEAGAKRWDLVVAHRDWTPTGGGPTVLGKVNGTSTMELPVTRASSPGEADDQPLWLVQWTKGQTQPTLIVDLRCWSAGGGVIAAHNLALKYLAKPGADVQIDGVTWRFQPIGNNVWDWVNQRPLEVSNSVVGGSKPPGAPLRTFTGFVNATGGAGGENRAASPATDSFGLGGLWFGYGGLPRFEGIYSVQLTGEHGLPQFAHIPAVQNVSKTRIKFKSRRLDGSGWANGYGSIGMYVTVVGW